MGQREPGTDEEADEDREERQHEAGAFLPDRLLLLLALLDALHEVLDPDDDDLHDAAQDAGQEPEDHRDEPEDGEAHDAEEGVDEVGRREPPLLTDRTVEHGHEQRDDDRDQPVEREVGLLVLGAEERDVDHLDDGREDEAEPQGAPEPDREHHERRIALDDAEAGEGDAQGQGQEPVRHVPPVAGGVRGHLLDEVLQVGEEQGEHRHHHGDAEDEVDRRHVLLDQPDDGHDHEGHDHADADAPALDHAVEPLLAGGLVGLLQVAGRDLLAGLSLGVGVLELLDAGGPAGLVPLEGLDLVLEPLDAAVLGGDAGVELPLAGGELADRAVLLADGLILAGGLHLEPLDETGLLVALLHEGVALAGEMLQLFFEFADTIRRLLCHDLFTSFFGLCREGFLQTCISKRLLATIRHSRRAWPSLNS